jgi:hypothetical protein
MGTRMAESREKKLRTATETEEERKEICFFLSLF